MHHPPHALRRCALIVFIASLGLASVAQDLEVHVIDVDQGLSVYVQSPTGVRFLIDGGNPGDGTAIVRPYLQSIGVTALDYSLMTHWHTDHLGGLNDLFATGYKPLIAAYDRGDVNKPSNSEVTQYMGLVAGKRVIPTIGQTIAIGGGATIQITALNGQWIGGSLDPTTSGQEENSRSMSVVIRYGDFDCYVGGDCTANGDGSTSNVEGPATAVIGQVEVAVAAHHGSNTSSTTQVVSNLNPSMVLLSCGHDNPYGHPTKTTVNRWNSSSASRVQWCTTDGDTGNGSGSFSALSGHAIITSNGTTFHASRSSGAETIDFTTFEHPGTLVGVGQLAVSEVLVDPLASADNFGEWWEVVNKSASTLDLFGLKFTSGPATFAVGSRILLDPAERFVFALDGRMTRNGGVFSGLGAPWEAFALANGTSSLIMKSATNATLETINWGSGGFTVVPGASAERIQAQNPPVATNFATALTSWSGGDLGTPWAINGNDPASCPTPTAFGAGKLTSIGSDPIAFYGGTPSLYTNDFSVVVLDAVPNKSCIAFYGPNQGTIPFYGGTLYVAPPIKRLPGHVLDVNGSSSWSIPIVPAMTGTTTFYQFWFRDPTAPDGTKIGLSNALRVDFCPSGAPPPPPPVGPGAIIVTEFMKDPAFVSDSNGEYLELYNTTAAAIDIEGWTLSDDGTDFHVISAGGNGVMIPAGQYRVLGINSNTLTNGGVPVLYQYANFFLGNSGDEIVLKDASAQEIDRVNYTAGAPWPSGSGKASNLKAGVLDGVLNDNPANWCVATSPISGTNPDKGTPALPNDTCP